MNTRRQQTNALAALAFLVIAAPMSASGQVPVDDDGQVIGTYEPSAATSALGEENIPLKNVTELEELVGPIALYPDDLLAIVLPASTNPLQVIEAGRFLEELENDPSLEPNSEWDDSIVAMLNYPEVVELMNEDIDWTWRLGEAVVAQQEDVVAAVESFRDRAYAAGNLHSDDYQNVEHNDGVIEITPVSDDVIYVPYYEPERVVVYQPRPVYYYYPRAYPVYYYPYPSYHDFDRGFFWGVTTAFTIGWLTDSLHVYHHSYRGHPFYGYRYRDNWWYRRPSINVYNTTYVRNTNITVNRYYGGDRWQPRRDRREYIRETRPRIASYQRSGRHAAAVRNTHVKRDRRIERREPIRFRSRPETTARQRATMQERVAHQREQRSSRRTQARDNSQRREPVARVRGDRQGPAARQRPERREPTFRQRAEQRQPVASQRSERREPATRQRTERREPAVRQRAERRQPVARQQAERREPVTRQRTERREPTARQRVERSASRTPPARAKAKREESRPAKRSENRRTEPRRERSKERRNSR